MATPYSPKTAPHTVCVERRGKARERKQSFFPSLSLFLPSSFSSSSSPSLSLGSHPSFPFKFGRFVGVPSSLALSSHYSFPLLEPTYSNVRSYSSLLLSIRANMEHHRPVVIGQTTYPFESTISDEWCKDFVFVTEKE